METGCYRPATFTGPTHFDSFSISTLDARSSLCVMSFSSFFFLFLSLPTLDRFIICHLGRYHLDHDIRRYVDKFIYPAIECCSLARPSSLESVVFSSYPSCRSSSSPSNKHHSVDRLQFCMKHHFLTMTRSLWQTENNLSYLRVRDRERGRDRFDWLLTLN